MVSRTYKSGRTTTFSVQAKLILRYCANKFISGPLVVECPFDPFDNGWIAKDGSWFRPYQQACHSDNYDGQGHSIQLTALGQQVALRTNQSGNSWETTIFVNGTQIKKWSGSPVDTTTPDTISVFVTLNGPAEEWIDETDSQTLEAASTEDRIRPVSAYDPRLRLYWQFTGPISISVDGDGSFSGTADSSIVSSFPLTVSVESTNTEHLFPVDYVTLPQTKDLLGLPNNSSYASVEGLLVNGFTIDDWLVDIVDLPEEHQSNISDYNFNSKYVSGTGSHVLTGNPGRDIPVNGVIRDWKQQLFGIPVQFDGSDPYLFTGVRIVKEDLNPTITPLLPFSPSDISSVLLRYDDEWTSLKIDRAKSLQVENFGHGWSGSDCSSGPTYANPYLNVTGGSGSPVITKTLVSDFNDIASDPVGWFTHNRSSLPTWLQDYWDKTGKSDSFGDHIGDWYKVGRKLLPGSDYFNWSSFRYLQLTGFADVECDIEIEVDYDQIYFTLAVGDNYTWVPNRTSVVVKYSVHLLTSLSDYLIDLPSKLPNHEGLRYINQVKISFPSSRSLSLKSLTLVEKSRPEIDVHIPTQDVAYLTGVEQGKHCHFQKKKQGGFCFSVYRILYPF